MVIMTANISNAYDEMRDIGSDVRDVYDHYAEWLKVTNLGFLTQKTREAELLFRRVGITFNVYGEEAGAERLIPFDVIPRILSATEWQLLSAGALQRVRALNAFLNDLYHEQEIIKAGIVIACCRHLGVPARYVSGYLFRPASRTADNHGWADVWIDGEWRSYDIGSGQRTNGIHIRLAVGLDGRDAGPVNAASRSGYTSTAFAELSYNTEHIHQ